MSRMGYFAASGATAGSLILVNSFTDSSRPASLLPLTDLQSGDLLIALVSRYLANGVDSNNSTESGWTLIDNAYASGFNEATDWSIQCFSHYKISDGTETTYSGTTSTDGNFTYYILQFRPVGFSIDSITELSNAAARVSTGVSNAVWNGSLAQGSYGLTIGMVGGTSSNASQTINSSDSLSVTYNHLLNINYYTRFAYALKQAGETAWTDTTTSYSSVSATRAFALGATLNVIPA